jgi:hypothetical protein
MPHGLVCTDVCMFPPTVMTVSSPDVVKKSCRVQRLKTLRGVGGHLPFGLPPQLETLEYTAEPAAGSNTPFSSERLAAAAETVARLPKLKQLTVQHCERHSLPPAFIR